jgi:uncharacterized protein YcbX
MSEVVGLYRYPLTGARAENLEDAQLNRNGIVGDRELVLYESRQQEDGSHMRVSQKEIRDIARISAFTTVQGIELVYPNYGNFYVPKLVEGKEVRVDEFGDITPAYDCGDAFARRFEYFTGKPSIRLAQKSKAWRFGDSEISPIKRRNRPVHIIHESTIKELRRRSPKSNFGADRFRPNIVLDGPEEAFCENALLEKMIEIGNAVMQVHDVTRRCSVPGNDQTTGKNLKDIPKLYPSVPKAEDDGKPIIGVYAYPITDEEINISLADRLKIVC